MGSPDRRSRLAPIWVTSQYWTTRIGWEPAWTADWPGHRDAPSTTISQFLCQSRDRVPDFLYSPGFSQQHSSRLHVFLRTIIHPHSSVLSKVYRTRNGHSRPPTQVHHKPPRRPRQLLPARANVGIPNPCHPRKRIPGIAHVRRARHITISHI